MQVISPYKERYMTSYAFINNILHVSIEGPATIYDLYDFLDELGNLHSLPEHLKVFYDLREASIDLRLDEINILSKRAEEKTLHCKSVKTAFCVQDPKITAYAMLFSWLPDNSKISRKQFSTKEAAFEWLNAE
ncbi:MAG: hypothetical protein MI866_14710 [Bacteroidales bacterium]|nr:hypothetical protein [Bacteroidales bacterium]